MTRCLIINDEAESNFRRNIKIFMLIKEKSQENVRLEKDFFLDDVLFELCKELNGKLVDNSSFQIDYVITEDGSRLNLANPITITSDDIDKFYPSLDVSFADYEEDLNNFYENLSDD
jgi:hypothetical protein